MPLWVGRITYKLFDALAAAQEAEELFREQYENCDEELLVKQPEDFLIMSYGAAVSLKVKEVKKKHELSYCERWQVGDRCNALFSGDGEWYKAVVLMVKEWRNAAVVKFTDYGNEEEVPLSDISKLELWRLKKEKLNKEFLGKESEAFLESHGAAVSLRVKEVKKNHDSSDYESWEVGDRCSALFSGDGEWYKATVLMVKEWRNAAIVRFTDYGNKEEVPLNDISKLEPWRVGDRCSALFHGDGEWYTATVLKVKEWRNAAVVKFTDYGNEEEVPLIDISKLEPLKLRKEESNKTKS